ncbi:GNAT family N-acetyltransferase [Halorarius halobius]|uniref:GNAT family N-acetyltransferase n=1 Tax=Halorarius halobius TaxID=2962671 RepID=UPI0020CC2404|nr:GNAT family N-acetyltransferase [Halorarius halobius]
MKFSDDLEFSHRDRRDIYEYVERYGTVDYEEARKALGMEPEAFGAHVTVLKRDGVISREEDELRIAFEDIEIETHDCDGVDVTIRQAHEDDLGGLVEAMHDALGDRTYVVGENVAETLEHEDVLLRHNEVQSRNFFVATVGGEVVGWVHLDHPETAALDHTAELTVGVVPDYRGKDIGGRLLDRAVRWAGEQGIEKLYNSVPATNEGAIAFLEGHGWETEAVRERHYHLGDDYVDEVMMAVWT